MTLNKHYWINFALWGLIGIGIMPLIEYTYYKFTPVEHYFHYASVESVRDVVYADDDLIMNSRANFRREAQVIWHDTLRCDLKKDEVFGFYSQQTTSAEVQKSDVPYQDKPWIYNGRVPENDACWCYVQSDITVKLPFNLEKTQTVFSDRFLIDGTQDNPGEPLTLPANN